MRIPWNWPPNVAQSGRPVELASHNHGEPNVGIVLVGLAPIVTNPLGDFVEFSVHVAEKVRTQDLVFGPWGSFPRLASQKDSLPLVHPEQQQLDSLGGWWSWFDHGFSGEAFRLNGII